MATASSIPGGVFGAPPEAQARNRMDGVAGGRGNSSSIVGGIFGGEGGGETRAQARRPNAPYGGPTSPPAVSLSSGGVLGEGGFKGGGYGGGYAKVKSDAWEGAAGGRSTNAGMVQRGHFRAGTIGGGGYASATGAVPGLAPQQQQPMRQQQQQPMQAPWQKEQAQQRPMRQPMQQQQQQAQHQQWQKQWQEPVGRAQQQPMPRQSPAQPEVHFLDRLAEAEYRDDQESERLGRIQRGSPDPQAGYEDEYDEETEAIVAAAAQIAAEQGLDEEAHAHLEAALIARHRAGTGHFGA